MTESGSGRGARTKQSIVKAAAQLIHVRGVAGTSVDDVLAESGTGKGQFYYYFENKDELVHEVLRYQLARYIEAQRPSIDNLSTWTGIRRWFDDLANQLERRKLVGGCPIGSLAAEMADRDEVLRQALADAFTEWESYLVRGLRKMKDRGSLASRAVPEELAESVMAAIQGGYLLATTKKDVRAMRLSLDAAYSFLRSFHSASGYPRTKTAR